MNLSEINRELAPGNNDSIGRLYTAFGRIAAEEKARMDAEEAETDPLRRAAAQGAVCASCGEPVNECTCGDDSGGAGNPDDFHTCVCLYTPAMAYANGVYWCLECGGVIR